MFYKIGFFVLLIVVLAMVFMFFKANPMNHQGAQSWIDLYSTDAAATVKFLEDNFGIKVVKNTDSIPGIDYTVIKAGGQMWPFAGVMQITDEFKGMGLVPKATIYLTVKDYEKIHKQLVANSATPVMHHIVGAGMKFGIYIIPGGLDIGVVQYSSKFK